MAKYLEAWGERKRMFKWVSDPRCVVNRHTADARLRMGWTPEDALATPYRQDGQLLTAWGETKHTAEWTADPRCVVTRGILTKRIGHGWTPEAAMTVPVVAPPAPHLVTAWGETKRMAEWADDPRCVVDYQALYGRLKKGMPPEDAITAPHMKQPVEPTAFGETKNIPDWAADPRCVVKERVLRYRHDCGWPWEAALTLPNGTKRP